MQTGKKVIVETLPNGTDSYGPTHSFEEWEVFTHIPRVSPCNFDIIVTRSNVFYRPDTYYYPSPYGWRKLF